MSYLEKKPFCLPIPTTTTMAMAMAIDRQQVIITKSNIRSVTLIRPTPSRASWGGNYTEIYSKTTVFKYQNNQFIYCTVKIFLSHSSVTLSTQFFGRANNVTGSLLLRDGSTTSTNGLCLSVLTSGLNLLLTHSNLVAKMSFELKTLQKTSIFDSVLIIAHVLFSSTNLI